MRKNISSPKLFAALTLSFSTLFLPLNSRADNVCHYSWSNLQKRAEKSENRIAFNNPAGPLNIGVCWWHSRMQRNANYLLSFDPSKKRMNEKESQTLIKNLSKTKTLQTARGYRNLKEFSTSYSREMQEVLGQWQLTESFFKLGWLKGVGPSHVSPENLNRKMKDLYEEVTLRKNISFQVLQMPGFKAHAWLVTDMKKIGAAGYEITAIDSNTQNLQKYFYQPGLTQFPYVIDGRMFPRESFVPYTHYENTWQKYANILRNSCSK